MKLTAVVVTFNRLNKLKESVDHLINQKTELYKIIIVNNCSSDGTDVYLSELKQRLPDLIEVLNLDKNVGGAGGFYTGSKKAIALKSDWVALSDDDAMYDTDYFEKIEEQIYNHPEYYAFSGNVINPDGSIQINHRRVIKNWSTIQARPLTHGEYSKNMDIDIFSFVGAVINSKAFNEVGFPNADFFINDDDTEFSLRIRTHGKIMNVSDAKIIHKSNAMINEVAARKREKWILFYGIRNHNYNVMKYSNNKFKANVYLGLQSTKRYALLFLGKHFSGRRYYFYKMFRLSGKRAKKGLLGIEQKYFPGV